MTYLVISYANICSKASILYRIVVYINIILTKKHYFEAKNLYLVTNIINDSFCKFGFFLREGWEQVTKVTRTA